MPRNLLRNCTVLIIGLAIVAVSIASTNQWVHTVHAVSPTTTRLAHPFGDANVVTSLPNTTYPILFIHGIDRNSAADCNGTWGNALSYLAQAHTLNDYNIQWSGPLTTLGYYQNDNSNCNDNLFYAGPSSHCVGYYDINVGTNDEPIEHLACELAWYIYTYYTSQGQSIDLVNYSMGGLIARWAIACSTNTSQPPLCSSPSNSNAFPNVKLLVPNAVDFDTPNGGLSKLTSVILCTCYEQQEMYKKSVFMQSLTMWAKNPQGASGTNWTTMGSYIAEAGGTCLSLDIDYKSATAMGNGEKIWYQNPCYNHIDPGSMLSDSSDTLDGQVFFCTSCGSKAPSWTSNVFPHSLLSMLYALTRLYNWGIVPSPNGNGESSLGAMAPISAKDVWAVGDLVTSSTLIEHWNGSNWSIISSPSPGGEYDNLSAVAAISPNDVWAVGYYNNYQGFQTLTEHWDGSSWSFVPSPNSSGSNGNYLLGVAAISAGDVWAVGEDDNAGKALIEHWDGTSWSIVSSPTIGLYSSLIGITAIATNDVWAVGTYEDNSGGLSPLIEHWDGTSWSVIPSPNPPGSPTLGHIYLLGVTALSSKNIWVVGYVTDPGNDPLQTLIEHWNGTKWSIIPSPNLGTRYIELRSVAAMAPNNIWAVGFSEDTSGDYYTLVEHWNGSSWNVTNSPDSADNPSSDLFGITVVRANSRDVAWAVGSSSALGYNTKTLIEFLD